MIKTYYLLTKPGIIMGNLITVAAGFVLASKGELNYALFLATMVGLGCVIASACVFNNYIDRSVDKKMARTEKRALVTGLVSGKSAIFYALLLGLFGFSVLFIYTNILTVIISAVGFFIYVAMYSFWKRSTDYATLVGSISGAVPPVVGYCAVSNHFDLGALLLFLIMVLWQMPHFFAIAMYHLEDYTAASIPVLPVKKGIEKTKKQMLLYILAFIPTVLLLTLFDYTGYAYLIVALVLSAIWLVLCVKGFKAKDNKKWGRQMFIFSLVTITGLCITIPFDVIQPLTL